MERGEDATSDNRRERPESAERRRGQQEGARRDSRDAVRRQPGAHATSRYDPAIAAQVEEWRTRQASRAVPASYRPGGAHADARSSVMLPDDGDVLDAQNAIPRSGRPVRTRPSIPNYEPRMELDDGIDVEPFTMGEVGSDSFRMKDTPRHKHMEWRRGAGDAALSAIGSAPGALRDSAVKVGAASSALVEDVRDSRAAAEARDFAAKVPGYCATAARWVGKALRNPDGTVRKKPLAIAAIVAIYLVIALYYSFHYYPFTSIGPVEVGGMDTAQAARALGDAVDGYQLQVKGDTDRDGSNDGEGDISFTVMGSDAGLSLDSEVLARQAMDADSGWLWPACILFPHDHSDLMVASADLQGFRDKVSDAVSWYNQDATAPTDATIAYDEDAQSFSVVPEERGDMLDVDKITDHVVEAITAMRSVYELGDDDYLQPAVLQGDARLKDALKQAQQVLQTNVTFTAHDSDVATLDGPTAAKWVVTDGDVQVSLDDDQVNAWVQDLVEKSSTVGAERTWTREDGVECKVSGGVYGWQADWAAVDDAVRQKALAGAQESVAVPMQQEAAAYDGPNGRDWKAYIDVDIDAQHATYYGEDGTVLWEADVVSGTPDGEHDSPEGVYYINNKESPSTLIGDSTATGSPEYETVVQYWMPWDGNSVGFHDAEWQDSFGGQRYANGYGSHGCINLSEEAAGALYQVAPIGTVVVCHSGTGLSTKKTSDGAPSDASSDKNKDSKESKDSQ